MGRFLHFLPRWGRALNCTEKRYVPALGQESAARWRAPTAYANEGRSFVDRATSSAGRTRHVRYGPRDERRVNFDVRKVGGRRAAEEAALFGETIPYVDPSIPNTTGVRDIRYSWCEPISLSGDTTDPKPHLLYGRLYAIPKKTNTRLTE